MLAGEPAGAAGANRNYRAGRFDSLRMETMLMLYHFPGAICAQKVRVALAEKSLTWESRSVLGELRSPDYLQLNPHGYVPTLVHNGQILIESRIISEYLEDAFGGPRLLPDSPFHRAQVRLWTKQIDDTLHLNVYVLTFATFYRPGMLQLSSEQGIRSLPLRNSIKRSYTLDLIEHGFESQYFPEAVARFRTLLCDMERTLSGSAWLAGGEYSLADADFTGAGASQLQDGNARLDHAGGRSTRQTQRRGGQAVSCQRMVSE
jgi:glutathione S-transferase